MFLDKCRNLGRSLIASDGLVITEFDFLCLVAVKVDCQLSIYFQQLLGRADIESEAKREEKMQSIVKSGS